MSGAGQAGFEESLAELKRWRGQAAGALAGLRRWALIARLIDEAAAARLAHLERRLASERLTIAFVAESARGKSELINALFFADTGARLLPAIAGRSILCPTEMLWDPARPPSLRLLPAHTQDTGRALREFFDEPEAWQEIGLDPSQPESLAPACEALLETLEGGAPRWRYAVINLPHPLLAGGLVVLDTAGRDALSAEPELSIHRVPDAAAIVFMLSADTGVAPDDRALWEGHIEPVAGIEETCFVALNKIDGLRGDARAESEVLSEIESRIRAAAHALKVAPTRVFAVSARQALTARLEGDRDAFLRSRLSLLEQALAHSIVEHRRLAHATAVRAEIRPLLAETRALVSSRLEFANEQLEEIAALQGKNQKLVEALARKAVVERGRIDQARATLAGYRSAHHRHADELDRLLNPGAARAAGTRVREAVASSGFSKAIGEALDAYFQESRDKIRRAVAIIDEEKTLMGTVSRKFTNEYKIAPVEATEFATGRFLVEIDRIEEQCDREFKGSSSLFTRGRKAMGTLFFDTVALKLIRVFDIADREARAWMMGFLRPLEAQIAAYQEQSNARIEGMGRIQTAEMDLLQRVEELRRVAAELDAQGEQWQQHQSRLMALIGPRRDRWTA
jgi:hypothetical protein